jgi:GT2 family glycosyltransferase
MTTYNWPSALNRALETVARQTRPLADVVIADDGSKEETIELVRDWQKRFPVPLIHAWQEDAGFRISRARNLAVSMSSGEYLVFTDGDCLLPPTYIEDHMQLAKPGWFISGRRIMMNAGATERALAGEIQPTTMSIAEMHRQDIFMKKSYARRMRRLPLGPLRFLQPLDLSRVEGCNMAIHRKDLLRLGGFDESYREFGHEDVDFAIRAIRSGMKGLRAEFTGAVMHLDHPRRSFGDTSEQALAAVRSHSNWRPVESMFMPKAG